MTYIGQDLNLGILRYFWTRVFKCGIGLLGAGKDCDSSDEWVRLPYITPIKESLMTDYYRFYYLFSNALATRELDSRLIYSDEIIEWFKKNQFLDLAHQASISLQRRSYPEEIDSWVKVVLSYLYDNTIEMVDPTAKVIPAFLLKPPVAETD